MKATEVNEALIKARDLIEQGRLEEARGVLDRLPKVLQDSAPVAKLRVLAGGDPPITPKSSKKRRGRHYRSRTTPPDLPPAVTDEHGIRFEPVAGAGFGGLPAYRCRVRDQGQPASE